MNENTLTTLRDIAEAAGVSIASVSKVLNNRAGVSDESRQKILAVAEQLGYQGRMARAFHRAGIGTAVMIVPAEYYSGSQFYEDIIRGALDEAAASSLNLEVRLVASSACNNIEEINDILQSSNHGAIVAIGLDDRQTIDLIAECGLPAVLINSMDRTMRIDTVLPDNWAAGWLAARRLLDAGHREIMHVTLPRRLSMQRRLEGFRQALEETGISFDEGRHILDLDKMGMQETQAQLAIRQAHDAGRLDKVTAFFCSMDVVALGVIQGLQSKGFTIPEDYSIVGLDDVAVASRSRPPLTTIRIDRLDLGRKGIQLLTNRIANPSDSVARINLGVKMIERATVAAPRTLPDTKNPHQT
ncbi:LacI family DNA-binding transcriptional regulator [Phyllobacterium myrsinacearum]|uniref:DNA-binding LacI/PurR family transcriptional regulator n=1 Tax=Phyllobacterium myrsinacearum TaxID=28101 RepID=A0A839EKM2_9HYPH|nr:LacI family DNA-binding transcriptional regulator [Phyllobacterium myrsinacearum]MBA8880993.1 DNA-binding LacI/PurR family transcriptional regulator [Phyllobacterium myrsinacearum]